MEKGNGEGRGGEREVQEEEEQLFEAKKPGGDKASGERRGSGRGECGGRRRGRGKAGVLSEQFDPARTCAHVLLPVVLLYWGVGGEIGL